VIEDLAGPYGEMLRCSTSSTRVSGSAGAFATMASMIAGWWKGTAVRASGRILDEARSEDVAK